MNQFRGFQRGINLGGWFSQCDNSVETYENFIRKEDFRTISEWGLDHVRIPVDYNLVEDDEGRYKESGFAYSETEQELLRKQDFYKFKAGSIFKRAYHGYIADVRPDGFGHPVYNFAKGLFYKIGG